MEMIYGIDLGTSNCLAAKATNLFDEIEVDCLIDDVGNISFPSIVHFATDEQVLIGEEAKRLLPDYPEKTIELVKLKMGKAKEIEIETRGTSFKKYSPQEISALLLKHFNHLHDQKIKKAILTVPAYFDDNEKAATLQAGKLAGIEIVELIEEPSAAIMYHLYNQYKQNKKNFINKKESKVYLVFDFGGGTLDLSLINVELDSKGNIKPTVLLKEGDSELGGNVIDLELLKLILEDLDAEYNDAFTNQVLTEFDHYYTHRRFSKSMDSKIKEFILRLKNTAEYAKIQLSTKDEVRIEYGLRAYENFDFSREDFEEEILEVYFRNRVIDILTKIKEKDQGRHQINEVILVGGTSQIPYFRKLISVQFPELKNQIIISEDYDNAIAKGAAILGAIKNNIEVPPFGRNRCFNTVSHNVLVNNELFIPYGTKFPFTKPMHKQFPIKHALQRNIPIEICEEYEKYNFEAKQRTLQRRIVKDVKFYHPFFYSGEKLTLILEIDDHGLLHFSAIHNETKEQIDFESEKLFQLDQHEFKDAFEKLSRVKEI